MPLLAGASKAPAFLQIIKYLSLIRLQMKIDSFSIPVYSNICSLDFSIYFKHLMEEVRVSHDSSIEYGSRTENTNLLDLEKYSTLKNWINEQLAIYARDILCWKFGNISITQSWVSLKRPGDKHLLHRHPNSLISGVLYWQDNIGSMYLKRPGLPQNIEIEIAKFNEYSIDWIEIKPEKGLLCLFPSYLEHFVSENNTTEDRYCLPFNSMIFEKIGFENNLTALDLRRSY